MADAKLSELTAATAAAGDDSLYMVQSSASRKITVANFFGDVTTPAKFSDSFSIAGYNTQTSIGAVTLTTNITYLSDPDAPGPLTLEAGSEGQIKIIIMINFIRMKRKIVYLLIYQMLKIERVVRMNLQNT